MKVDFTSSEVLPSELIVLADETIGTIKEKLFVFGDGINFYPNLISLQIQTKTKDELITASDIGQSLIFYLPSGDSIGTSVRVVVKNVINVIEGGLRVDGKNYSALDLWNDINIPSNKIGLFESAYAELSNEYAQLSEADFEFAIKLVILKTNACAGTINCNTLRTDIDEYIKNVLEAKTQLIKVYKRKESGLTEFYNSVLSIRDINELVEPVYNYTNVSVIIRGGNVETGLRGKFIKLLHVFNQIELTDNLPFVAISIPGKEEPMIKIHNKLIERVGEREVKSWMISEKKKANVVTYKKVRGLMLKYKTGDNRYITFNITDTGIVYCKVGSDTTNGSDTTKGSETVGTSKLDDIYKLIRDTYNNVTDIINKLYNVFSKPKRLEPSERSEFITEALTCSIYTKILINRSAFNRSLVNTFISDYVFELKDTISEDILSIYYKKYGKREGDDIETERRGITVNIRDNPYKLDSSVITVYSAFNVNQIDAILYQIAAINSSSIRRRKPSIEQEDDSESDYSDTDEETVQKIKERSHIKSLRKQGVNILSTKCQKPRQPKVGDELEPLAGSYTLDYNSIKYICPSKEYPYPGFTNENIVCCFKKDQRRRHAYIRNTKSTNFDILVQPSNFKITITQANNKPYETFAIKVISDYIDGLDSTNSVSRYYFISPTNELVPITNQQLIDRIGGVEEDYDIWLDSVPLANIINEPPKNKCNYPPDMNKTIVGKDGKIDTNARCSHHAKNKIFGYNLNSYPCCFDKEREQTVSRKKKVIDITKQHILTSDKVLDYQRIGILPPPLDKLFNKLIQRSGEYANGKFYRMGVVQNQSAFFNAILLGVGNTVGSRQVNNSNELRKVIVGYLEGEPGIFQQLSNGNMINKYKTMSNYTKAISDVTNVIYWNDVLDLLQRMLNINVLLLDIPYKISESTKEPDYENIRLVCTPNIKTNNENPFLVLLKRGSTYEIVIWLAERETDSGTIGETGTERIRYMFKYDNSDTFAKNIVNFLLEYRGKSCVRENDFPENYPYIEMYSLDEIIKILGGGKNSVIAQIVNKFKKVNWVITQKGIIIPVKETGITDGLRVVNMNELQTKLPNLEKYIIGIADINQTINKTPGQDKQIRLIGVTTRKQDDEDIITSVLTNYGQHIPLAPSKYTQNTTVPQLEYGYYPEIDDILFDFSNDPSLITKNADDQVRYTTYWNGLREYIYKIKRQLGERLYKDDQAKSNIQSIITDTMSNRFQKLTMIVNILRLYVSFGNTYTRAMNDFVLSHIANEMLNDNIENSILNNVIASDVFNPSEVISRDEETVLLNIDDIKRWIKQFSS